MPDYGNDFATASIVDVNTLVDGELHSGNTEDWFRVILPNGLESFSVYFLIKTGGQYVHIFDENQVSMYSGTYAVTLNNPTSGLYYFQIAGGIGDYEIGLYTVADGNVTPLNTTISHITEYPDTGSMGFISLLGTVSMSSNIWWITNAPNVNGGTFGNWVAVDEGTSFGIDGFKYPDEYFKPKMIMMGDPIGVSTPFMLSYDYNNTTRYVIKGKVSNEGLALSNKTLRLYDRSTGHFLDETLSDANGLYEFTSLLWSDSKYYVIAFDDMENPDLQAIVIDALVPIEQ